MFFVAFICKYVDDKNWRLKPPLRMNRNVSDSVLSLFDVVVGCVCGTVDSFGSFKFVLTVWSALALDNLERRHLPFVNPCKGIALVSCHTRANLPLTSCRDHWGTVPRQQSALS